MAPSSASGSGGSITSIEIGAPLMYCSGTTPLAVIALRPRARNCVANRLDLFSWYSDATCLKDPWSIPM